MSNQIVEIEIDPEEQKKLIKEIINLGSVMKVSPLLYSLALVSAFKVICDETNIQYDDLLALLEDCEQSEVH